jgi:hypothetical protein
MAVLLIARPIIVTRFARVSLMKQKALLVIGETWLIVLGCGTGRARLLPYFQQIITDLQGFSLLLLRNPHLFENVAFFSDELKCPSTANIPDTWWIIPGRTPRCAAFVYFLAWWRSYRGDNGLVIRSSSWPGFVRKGMSIQAWVLCMGWVSRNNRRQSSHYRRCA